MPATSHSNPQPLEMNGIVCENSIFSAKMTGVKRKELDPGLSFPVQNFIKDLQGEFTIIIIYQFVTRDTEKCSFSILTRLTYEHWNIWTFCRYKQTIRFIRVLVLSEMEGFHAFHQQLFLLEGLQGWRCSQFMVYSIWTVPIIWFKNSTVFTT